MRTARGGGMGTAARRAVSTAPTLTTLEALTTLAIVAGLAGAAAGLTTLAALAALARPAAAQEPVRLSSGAAEIELGGRLQLQAATSSCAGFRPGDAGTACEAQVPDVDMFIRRARLTVDAKVDDFLEGRIQPEFGELDEFELKDAWGRILFAPAARLTAGHMKRPFDGFQMTSSTRILTIERDLDIPGVPGPVAASYDEFTTRFHLSDRDVGLMLDGETPDGRFRYWLGAFNGRGPTDNEDLNTEKQLVGRGEVRLDAGGHPLALAAAVALTDVPFTDAEGGLAGEYFPAVELWAELGDWGDGPHVQAGLVLGDNPLQNEAGGVPDLAAGQGFAGMMAWQVIGAYRIPVPGDYLVQAVEPLFRVTRADPNRDREDDASWGFTPGLQLFFAGRNRVAVNWDVARFEAGGLRTEHSVKAQYQFHF